MRTYNIHFFVEGRDYGRGRIAAVPTNYHQDHAASWTFVCPRCGRQWASCGITDLEWPGEWNVITALCERHSVPWAIAGSLWKSPWQDLIDAFPPSVLARELQLHLDYLEKEPVYAL